MFTITFDTANDAFQDDPGPEIWRILHEVAARVGNGYTRGLVVDVNGNRVGEYRYTTDPANPA